MIVRGRGGRVALPVLLYHRVGPPVPGTFPSLAVSPGRFRAHLRWLRRGGFSTISPRDWLDWCHHAVPLPRRPLMITFDDGYADLDRHAFPALREHGFTAVVFAVSGCLGGTNAWDAEHGSGPLDLLTAEQVRRWAAEGIEFGAHTRTHADLAARATALASEIDGSADDLRRLLGRDPDAFAYPWGRTAPAADARVRARFSLAFTTGEGLNTRGTDLHRLRRTMVQPGDGTFALGARVYLGSDPLSGLRARVRLRSRLRALLRLAPAPEEPACPAG